MFGYAASRTSTIPGRDPVLRTVEPQHFADTVQKGLMGQRADGAFAACNGSEVA
ncbi:hypothetical protein ACFC0C_30940 [Streptomyces sp. NPDC056178]|uniref:hypothetical protein n=1 Tax=unclassified Streptomyces TaxID=2593676 RepID=UPI0035DAFFB3